MATLLGLLLKCCCYRECKGYLGSKEFKQSHVANLTVVKCTISSGWLEDKRLWEIGGS